MSSQTEENNTVPQFVALIEVIREERTICTRSLLACWLALLDVFCLCLLNQALLMFIFSLALCKLGLCRNGCLVV
jgi:hypothetical protein